MGAVQRRGVVIDVVVDVLVVGMGGNEKGVFSLCPAHCRFIANAVGLLRGDLSGLERLADLIAQHIRLATLFPACGGLVLGLPQKKLRIGSHRVALIGGKQLTALGLVWVHAIVKTVFEGLGNGFALADFVLDKTGGCRRLSSFLGGTLGHFVP